MLTEIAEIVNRSRATLIEDAAATGGQRIGIEKGVSAETDA